MTEHTFSMLNRKRARIVEIIGAAGAGKTTLYDALARQDNTLYAGNFPDVRAIGNVPFFLRSGLQVLQPLITIPRQNSRSLTRREFAWLAILRGWPKVLKKQSREHNCILLDQGPVYLMTELYGSGPQFLRSDAAEFMWREFYHHWANTLTTIVWLDAPDAVLQQRIASREKDHIVKNESPETQQAFLSSFRRAYERTICLLESCQKNLRVLRFDTSNTSPEKIAAQLAAELLLPSGSAQ